jgi:hypothetical protein
MAAGFIGEGISPDIARQRLQERQAADGNKRQLTTVNPSEQRMGGSGGPSQGDLERAAQARFRAQRGVRE